MSVLSLKQIFTLLLLLGLSQAGLVHRRNAKENAALDLELHKDRIPVAIVLESDSKPSEPEENLKADDKDIAPAAELAPSITKIESLPLPAELPAAAATDLPIVTEAIKLTAAQQIFKELPDKTDLNESVTEIPKKVQESITTEGIKAVPQTNEDIASITEKSNDKVVEKLPEAIVKLEDALTTLLPTDNDSATLSTIPESLDLKKPAEQLPISEQQSLESASPVVLLEGNSLKALPAVVSAEQLATQDVAPNVANDVVVVANDDLERQATQATPTQSSTPQNFVQQLIQNSPIGQFLSQFTGGQQQQQQSDQPATPQPTLPGFLNPANAITSAQQAVQNAAQSVVNSTTQAFQGLQQFATNLGTQFQNTFSNLAGQQNQLTTADSTTPRPPGPIQQIVSNFIGGNNATAAAGQQPGPLQGILGFFQGGNRPQNAATTSAPPKEMEAIKPGVDDKIETQSTQNDEIIEQPQEPESANEVRSSAEVINEDSSLEAIGPADELIIVNDDATQQDVSV